MTNRFPIPDVDENRPHFEMYPALHFEVQSPLRATRYVRLDLIDTDQDRRVKLTARERHLAIALCKHAIEQLSRETP